MRGRARSRWPTRRSIPAAADSSPIAASLRWSGGEAKVTGFEVVGRQALASARRRRRELTGTVEAGGRSRLPPHDAPAAHRHPCAQRAGVPAVRRRAGHRRADGEDGTARMDFDLPGADNDRLRALEAPINDVIRQDIAVNFAYVPMRRGAGRARPDPQPLGRAAAHAGRHDPHRRDRRASTARPAAARISPRPAARRRSASSRSTTRAATIAASASPWLIRRLSRTKP